MPLFASLTLVKETALTRGCFSKISVTDFVYRKRTPSYRPTVTDMVVHDMKAMQDNIGALDGIGECGSSGHQHAPW